MKAYLSLGTNLGDRLDNLQNAVNSLKLLPETSVVGVSSVYETDPVGYENQPDFLNIAVAVETMLSPEMLLGASLGIESALGRIRLFKNGPRVIDIDLLLYGDEKRDTPSLTLPHPRMLEREFVLKPLCELNGEFSNALSAVECGKARKTNSKIIF